MLPASVAPQGGYVRTPNRFCRVEEERGGVSGTGGEIGAVSFVAALAEKPITSFRLSLIEPDVTISPGNPALGRVSRGGIVAAPNNSLDRSAVTAFFNL